MNEKFFSSNLYRQELVTRTIVTSKSKKKTVFGISVTCMRIPDVWIPENREFTVLVF
jgi:hypothetical protein